MHTSVPDSWRAPRGTGYDPTAERTVERVLPMLAEERVVWLSTVRPDGTPHLVPTWFWWDGDALVVFSKPGAAKVRNLRTNPRLMVAVGDAEDDFSVGLIEATAAIVEGPADVPDAFFVKYGSELGPGGLDPDTFRALYTQQIRISPTRFLAWHGRSERHDSATVPAGRFGVLRVVATWFDRIAARLRGTGGAMPAPLAA
jgi:PPOX class probable F420-dependent enzyme